MEPLVNAYWTAKFGSSADEYEDAFAWSANSRHFAIADGATESSFADRWAKSLVREYSKQPPSPAALPDWLKPLQEEWQQTINWDTLPWFAEEKARLGAFATFLGLSFASAKRKKRGFFARMRGANESPEALAWRACAVGDSCLFQVRGGQLVTSFPLTRSEEFQSRPVLLSSNPAQNDSVWNEVRVSEGDCRPGDLFFALTDALAKWFLAENEAGRQPWKTLTEIQAGDAFEQFVQELRERKAIRNDDTTMLLVRWKNDLPNPNRRKDSL
jgi:hypothetical protein